jgi:hypothetical protein
MPFPPISTHPIFGETDNWLIQEAVMLRYAHTEAEALRDEAAWRDAKQTAHQMAQETA